MTYIIGTTFSVRRQELKPGITSSSLRPKAGGNFLPPGTYTINYIKPIKEGVDYTFINQNGEAIVVTFKSIGQAEEFISSAKGERIPNYTEIYSKLA